MCRINDLEIGIYEKALPKNTTWEEKLTIAKNANYTFIEISVDETDERLARLDWTLEERMEFRDAVLKSGLRVPSMCFSGHRRFPLGSENVETRNKALELMRKAIEFAVDTGIRTIQLAGYDVYYEESNDNTKRLFIEGLKESVRMAEKGIVLLENDGILPLKENAQKILITGFNADNKLAYLGNYFGDPSHFVMVTEAISQYNIDTEFIRGIHLYNQSTKHDKETALKSAAESDIIIMCTGQT